MNSNDILVKALALDDTVRVYVLKTTDLVNEAIRRCDTYPSASDCLGKALTVTCAMGAMLKGDEELTVKINGSGPIGNIICDSDATGAVRGYCDNPHVNFVNNNGGLNTVYTLGTDGLIEVIKDLKLKDFFTSSIPLQTGNLAYDFTYYFTVSEQTPSVVSLGSLFDVDNRAKVFGGVIIQLLPNCPEENIQYIESKLHLLNNLSQLLIDLDTTDILKMIFNDNFKVLDTLLPRFECKCSKEKLAASIATLGCDEIKDMIEKDHGCECVCHYCKEVYNFSEEELQNILDEVTNNGKTNLNA